MGSITPRPDTRSVSAHRTVPFWFGYGKDNWWSTETVKFGPEHDGSIGRDGLSPGADGPLLVDLRGLARTAVVR